MVRAGTLVLGSALRAERDRYRSWAKDFISRLVTVSYTHLIEAAESNDKVRISKSKGGIVVKGIDDVAVRFSKCCSPVPGDEIVGYVTRGRGVSIHRTDCVNIINLSSEERVRLIDAEWQQPEVPDASAKYTAEIKVYGNNRTGLLVDVAVSYTHLEWADFLSALFL